MSEHESCPHCGASLQGEPIPEPSRHWYGDGVTHYSRKIGHEIRGVYDGVLYWSCPDCGEAWQRFTYGGRLTHAGERYVEQHNARMAELRAIHEKTLQRDGLSDGH